MDKWCFCPFLIFGYRIFIGSVWPIQKNPDTEYRLHLSTAYTDYLIGTSLGWIDDDNYPLIIYKNLNSFIILVI